MTQLKVSPAVASAGPRDEAAIQKDIAQRRYFETAAEAELAKTISETQGQLRTAMETATYCEKQLMASTIPGMWQTQMDEQVLVVQNLCDKLKMLTTKGAQAGGKNVKSVL